MKFSEKKILTKDVMGGMDWRGERSVTRKKWRKWPKIGIVREIRTKKNNFEKNIFRIFFSKIFKIKKFTL